MCFNLQKRNPITSEDNTIVQFLKIINKMKKIHLLIFTVFLNIAMFSCTSQSLAEENPSPQACCGDDGELKPPPPRNGGGQ